MSVRMHFSTFMKFLTQSTADRIRGLEKYAKPGGFDFWQGSREGTLKMMGGLSRVQARKQIQAAGAENTVKLNSLVFDATTSWIDRQNGKTFRPEKRIWTSPRRIFSVHIEPEIGFEKSGGQRRIVAIYPRRTPRLDRDIGGAGVLMLKRGYPISGNEQFGILDALAEKDKKLGKAFWSPTNLSEAVLDEEINSIEETLMKVFS